MNLKGLGCAGQHQWSRASGRYRGMGLRCRGGEILEICHLKPDPMLFGKRTALQKFRVIGSCARRRCCVESIWKTVSTSGMMRPLRCYRSQVSRLETRLLATKCSCICQRKKIRKEDPGGKIKNKRTKKRRKATKTAKNIMGVVWLL
jgi:hypothetical protein